MCHCVCHRTGIVLRQGHLERGELNVKGSSITVPSDSGPDALLPCETVMCTV